MLSPERVTEPLSQLCGHQQQELTGTRLSHTPKTTRDHRFTGSTQGILESWAQKGQEQGPPLEASSPITAHCPLQPQILGAESGWPTLGHVPTLARKGQHLGQNFQQDGFQAEEQWGVLSWRGEVGAEQLEAASSPLGPPQRPCLARTLSEAPAPSWPQ